jgi:hypothetical protein
MKNKGVKMFTFCNRVKRDIPRDHQLGTLFFLKVSQFQQYFVSWVIDLLELPPS